MNILLWAVLPYVTIAILVVGSIWRYRYDKFGWTTRSSQLYESRLLRIGSPLFHFGILVVIIGHFIGLVIPESWTSSAGLSEDAYHVQALALGGIAGSCTLVGIAILVYRPEGLLAASDAASLRWRTDFIRTYLERDIPQLGPRIPAETLRRLWTMLAHQQGGLLNAAALARALAVDGKTIASYLDLLVDLLLVRRLSQQNLGLYKQAFFVVTTAMNLLPLGFAMSAFYFLPRERSRQPAIVANILAFLAGMGGLAALLLMIWPGFIVIECSTLAPGVPSYLSTICERFWSYSLNSGFNVVDLFSSLNKTMSRSFPLY